MAAEVFSLCLLLLYISGTCSVTNKTNDEADIIKNEASIVFPKELSNSGTSLTTLSIQNKPYDENIKNAKDETLKTTRDEGMKNIYTTKILPISEGSPSTSKMQQTSVEKIAIASSTSVFLDKTNTVVSEVTLTSRSFTKNSAVSPITNSPVPFKSGTASSLTQTASGVSTNGLSSLTQTASSVSTDGLSSLMQTASSVSTKESSSLMQTASSVSTDGLSSLIQTTSSVITNGSTSLTQTASSVSTNGSTSLPQTASSVSTNGRNKATSLSYSSTESNFSLTEDSTELVTPASEQVLINSSNGTTKMLITLMLVGISLVVILVALAVYRKKRRARSQEYWLLLS